MKKVITITCLILSAIIILDNFNVWHALAMFYIAGEVPGTETSINAGTMMAVFAMLIGFVIARIGNRVVLALINHPSSKQTHRHA